MMHGVMFDFSGTLFRIEPVGAWFDSLGLELTQEQREGCVRALTAAGAQPGGPQPTVPTPPVWESRDVTAAQHRAAFTGQTVAALTGLVPDPESAAARLYARHMQPEAWEAYPDAEGVLKELRRRGVPVAVVSNIGWDLRPVFVAHGLDVHVDSYVLSYELEVQKPDPRIFRAACGAIGVRPDEALMVGDDLAADGGAVRVGCAFHRVLPLTPAERPNALEEVLGLVGAGAQ